MSAYYVYILASQKHGTLYVGSTNNLARRVWEHKEKVVKGFTSKYNISRLVYFEPCDSPDVSSARERQLKKWKRDWKVALIEERNPDWVDLYNSLNL